MRSLARGGEPREGAAPAGAQPLVAVSDHHIGRGVVDIDHAERLDGVEDEQAVGTDRLAKRRQVGAIPGAEVDVTHGEGDHLVIQHLPDGISGHASVLRGDPPRDDRTVRCRRCALQGQAHAGELGGARDHSAGQAEQRVHESVGRRRLQGDVVGFAAQQLGDEFLGLTDALGDQGEGGRSSAAEQVGVGEHLFAYGGRQRAERRPVQVAGLVVEGVDIVLESAHFVIVAWVCAGPSPGQRPKRLSRSA